MTEPIWISRRVVDAIHDALLSEHGGRTGVRDENAIESALARPRNQWAYAETGIITLAASYAFGLCRNHGYVDGNKRVAFAAMATFLRRNGIELTASESGAVAAMLSLASGEWDEDRLAEWLRANVR